MDASEKFCLTWNDFESNISASFKEMRKEEDFFDVTLACEDDSQLEAHKVVLSACSKFFQKILRKNKHQHPLLYLKGVKYSQLESILSFMYHGETSIGQNDLTAFLSVAEELEVKGLTQKEDKSSSSNANSCTNSSKKSNKQTKKNEAAKQNNTNRDDDDDDIQEIQQENNIKTDQNEVVDVESEFQDGTGNIEDSYGYYYQGYDGMVSTGSMDTDYQNNLSSLEQYGSQDQNDPNTVKIDAQIIERFSSAWKCGICKKMCSTRKSTVTHLIEVHQMSENKINKLLR